jgi:short-subunit dehydrogenase
MRIQLKPLNQQVVVITGASSGIGLTTARLAARRGARLVLVARNGAALRELADEIRHAGGCAIAVIADVGSETDVQRIAEEAVRAFGHVDTWVNNAAGSVYGRALDVTPAEMRRVFGINFWGVVYGSRAACGLLRPHGGALINVGSVLSDRAVPLQGIYSASKHAVKGWTDSLRTELMHEHAPISVTLIKPGPIDTPYAEHARSYLGDQPTHVPPVYAPESVAEAIVYAAEHPVRELYVGSSGRLLSIVNGFWPGLTDIFMARAFIPATHSGRPRRSRDLLFRAGSDLRDRGDYEGLVRRSLYTRAIVHRWWRPAAGVAIAVFLSPAWRRRRVA